MNLKGSKTEKNLLIAFARESQARNCYDFAASTARREGYEQIADIFEETAVNEREHARRFFRFLEGGVLEITAHFPAGVLGSTAQNLRVAADGERAEAAEVYPAMAKMACAEGFEEIAAQFETIGIVEAWHEKRFRQILASFEGGTVFKKGSKVYWKCGVCGNVHEGVEPPEHCPCCLQARKYFSMYNENY